MGLPIGRLYFSVASPTVEAQLRRQNKQPKNTKYFCCFFLSKIFFIICSDKLSQSIQKSFISTVRFETKSPPKTPFTYIGDGYALQLPFDEFCDSVPIAWKTSDTFSKWNYTENWMGNRDVVLRDNVSLLLAFTIFWYRESRLRYEVDVATIGNGHSRSVRHNGTSTSSNNNNRWGRG